MEFSVARALQIRARLLDLAAAIEDAAADLARIADMTRQEPTLAAAIAERVRADRLIRRHDLQRRIKESLVPGQESRLHHPCAETISSDHAARCVAHAGAASLTATAILELEEEARRPSPEWAKALVAVAGDAGTAHLVRMRVRPNWSELLPAPEPPPFGIEALVSPIADVRRAALAELAATPRPVHLRALLLAAELERHVSRKVLRLPLNIGRWAGLLAAHARSLRFEKIPGVSLAFDDVAQDLLYRLVDAGGARAPMETPQHLTPTLRELEVDGVVAFAARHMPDPLLTDEERGSLEGAEVELAASAAHLWPPPDPIVRDP